MSDEIDKIFNETPSSLVKYGLYFVAGIIISTLIILYVFGVL